MRPAPALLLALLAALSACTPPSGRSLPTDALDDAIGRSIGDPATCVILADRATNRVVYRYGTHTNCGRALPACDRPGSIVIEDTLHMIDIGPRTASCASGPGRTVAWAAGPAPGRRALNYAALMEGERTLPGIEIKSRLESALQRAGL